VSFSANGFRNWLPVSSN